MNPKDDDILFSESRNLSDDADDTDKAAQKETTAGAINALEKQGIFLEKKVDKPLREEPHDEFSKELKDIGGIEIIPNDDTEI